MSGEKSAEAIREESYFQHQIAMAAFAAWMHGTCALKAHDAHRKYSKTDTFLDPLGPFMEGIGQFGDTETLIGKAFEAAFLASLGRYYRWYDRLRKMEIVPVELCRPMEHFREDAMFVRNVWEHADEYAFGLGHRQGEFNNERDCELDGYKKVQANALWSITIGGEYVLGNRLNMLEATVGARTTFKNLAEAGFAHSFPKSLLNRGDVDWFCREWPKRVNADALRFFDAEDLS